ncbi:hypothetical protein B9R42_13695 [Arthrospira platensis PCC 7345]|nr:MAG: hypothetical protein EA414_00305 [Arthrospira sp. PLM2.Bin9]
MKTWKMGRLSRKVIEPSILLKLVPVYCSEKWDHINFCISYTWVTTLKLFPNYRFFLGASELADRTDARYQWLIF